MCRIARLLIAALFLFVGTAVLAGPAVAAPEPATPYRYADCYGDSTYEYCFSGHGVFKQETSASGNQLYKFSGSSKITYSENGEMLYQGSEKYNSVAHDNGAGVYHSNGQGEFSYGDTTCTYKYNFTYANGEVRHEAYDFECSP